MLIQKEVEVKITSYNIFHFQSLGYEIKDSEVIVVPTEHLPLGSGIKVDVQCKYCNVIFKKAYRKYVETKTNLCCTHCRKYKIKDSNMDKYNVSCTLHYHDFKKKKIQTFINKYGVAHPLKNEMVKQKSKNTMMERYGVPYSIFNPESKNKMRETMKKNKKYFIHSSKAQTKINNIYNGILNYNIGDFFIDIYLPDDNIAIEYDGGGHWLPIKFNKYTREEFDNKEYKRERFIISNNLRLIRIINKKDCVFEEPEILSIKDRAKKIFEETDNNVYKYNLITKTELSLKI